MINVRPSYYAIPYILPANLGYPKRVPHKFAVYENGNFCFAMSNQGDRLQNILKRGIPIEDARKLFYEMDE